MSLSRKEFLRQGLVSLGKGLCTIAGAVDTPLAAAAYPGAGEPGEGSGPLVAVAHNERCLAGGCGCFLCLERCPEGAIAVVAGEGIRIDAGRCSGCGICAVACPVSPKAVSMGHRGH